MGKWISSAAISFFVGLSGCATSQPDPGFSRLEGVRLSSDGSQNQYFESVTFTKPAHEVGSDDLPLCVTRTVQNRSVSLTDDVGSGFGPYTGNYYTNSQTRESGGGNVLSFVSKEGDEVVANGMTAYELRSGIVPIKRAVRYVLTVQASLEETSYEFDSLEQAQLNTGTASNTGFGKIGAWPGANPDYAYRSLQGVAESIEKCLASR